MPIGTELIINKDISYSVIQVGHGGSVVPEPYLDSWVFLHLHNETRYSLICLPTVSSDAPTVPFACLMTSELLSSAWVQPSLPHRVAGGAEDLGKVGQEKQRPGAPAPGLGELMRQASQQPGQGQPSARGLLLWAPCTSALVGLTGPGFQGCLEPAFCPRCTTLLSSSPCSQLHFSLPGLAWVFS